MSRLLAPVIIVAVGIAVMSSSVFGVLPGQLGIIALGLGFLIVVAGLVIAVSRTLSRRSTGTSGDANRGLRLRMLMGGLGLAGLALPLLRVPLEPGAPIATGLELVQALVTGHQADAVLIGSVFVGVLVASTVIAVMTEFGGLLMLVDVVAVTWLASDASGRSLVDIPFGVFGIGMYVVVAAGLGILATRFVSSGEVGGDSDWSPSHR